MFKTYRLFELWAKGKSQQKDPMGFLFDLAGEMVDGIFDDVAVAFSALLVLGFMVLGISLLQKIFLRDETVGAEEQELRRERADEAKEF